MSMQLDSVEEQLERSRTVRETGGATIVELEKERDMLLLKRDTLDAQLRDKRVLTVEVRKNTTLCVLCTCHFSCTHLDRQ